MTQTLSRPVATTEPSAAAYRDFGRTALIALTRLAREDAARATNTPQAVSA